jgi:hypothetical protein
LDKIAKKDVRKGLLLGNYDGVKVEEYNVVNSYTNENSMPLSNHQYVGEPSNNMLQANKLGQLQDVERIVTQKLEGQNYKFDSPRKQKHKKVHISECVSSAKTTRSTTQINCTCGSKK